MAPQSEAPGDPRVLIFGNEWATTRSGGLNRYLADLLGALRRCGVPATAVVVGPADENHVISASNPSRPLLCRLAKTVTVSSRLSSTVDVVDVHFALYGLLPITTTRLRSRPLVAHFQGPWADESVVGRGQAGMVVRMKRAIERAIYRRAEVVIVLSQRFGDLVTKRYGVDPSRVVVVPPGVDLDRFHPGDRAVARRRFELPEPGFVAVTVRRLDARMGLDVLLEAWRKVQAERDDALLLIAGEGRERERLDALRRKLPDPERVRLLGRISEHDLVTLYQAADISVVPTRDLEGFGLVTLESLACGTPPIVTDVGGLPDGVRGLDASLVVSPEDAPALAERVLAAAEGAVPSGAQCRAHAETFKWETVARRHIELYRRAMGQRPTQVAYIGHTAELSGGELALARTLRALENVDAQVFLAEDGPLVDRLESVGATVEVLPMGERTRSLRKGSVSRRLPLAAVADTVAYSVRLARRLRRLRPDIVHTNTLKAALYGGIAGRLAGVPVVWHVRDRIAPAYLPRSAVWLVRAASRVVPTMVVANSDATLATLGRGPRRSAVVPSPVEFPSIGEVTTREREDRPFTVGLVGRLAPWKGQDLFLRAFAAAFAGGEQRAVVVGSALFGEDEWAGSLPRLAGSLGIADQVEFTGFVDDVGSVYRGLDALVHASTIPEPFGQVVVEGMAAGLPVVAANAGGPAEIITNEVNGLLYPMGQASALAERLQALASSAALRRRLGDAGRQRAAVFEPCRVAAQMMTVYRSV